QMGSHCFYVDTIRILCYQFPYSVVVLSCVCRVVSLLEYFALHHVKIFATGQPQAKGGVVPGKIAADGKHLTIDCGDGALEVLSLQLAGKKRMPAPDFMRGFNLDGCSFV
ncbi:MAG: hypothetical protein IIT96_04910, partial [Muribaculaceae bacterium]|nr:hypothetical protein [Muribaculaceae bacterium]